MNLANPALMAGVRAFHPYAEAEAPAGTLIGSPKERSFTNTAEASETYHCPTNMTTPTR